MTRSVSAKMGINSGTRSLLVHAPDEAVEAMSLPDLDLKRTRRGTFGYIHLFVKKQAEMERTFPGLTRHLARGGMLWVSWPKGGKLGTDLSLREVIRIGYDHGVVESTTLRIDDTWAAIKFTHPKPGKTYRNRYGKLPEAFLAHALALAAAVGGSWLHVRERPSRRVQASQRRTS